MATLQEEIAAKANITVDQAKLAYDHVLDTIKSKIPPSLGDEIHKVMDGHEFNLDSVKSSLADTAHDWQQKASSAFQNLTDQAKSLFGK
jgi:hypothetical protein